MAHHPRGRVLLALLVAAVVAAGITAVSPASADPLIITLSASNLTPRLNEMVTLTATADVDYISDPWWSIEVHDLDSGAWIAHCTRQYTCSDRIGYDVPESHRYIAYIVSSYSTLPPPGPRSASNVVGVTWGGIPGPTLVLTANPPSQLLGIPLLLRPNRTAILPPMSTTSGFTTRIATV